MDPPARRVLSTVQEGGEIGTLQMQGLIPRAAVPWSIQPTSCANTIATPSDHTRPRACSFPLLSGHATSNPSRSERQPERASQLHSARRGNTCGSYSRFSGARSEKTDTFSTGCATRFASCRICSNERDALDAPIGPLAADVVGFTATAAARGRRNSTNRRLPSRPAALPLIADGLHAERRPSRGEATIRWTPRARAT